MMLYMRLLSLLLVLEGVQLRQGGCREGHIKDVDGVTCVKMITYPPMARKTCPEPVVQHGNIFFSTSGKITMVEFFCDTGYIMVPDNSAAICREFMGQWSKQIPTCLKQGCPEPENPGNGAVFLEYDSTLAVFACNPGYTLKGSKYLGCEDGVQWNSTAPFCEKIPVPVQPAPKTTLGDGGSSAGTGNGDRTHHVGALLLLAAFSLRFM